MNTHRICFVSPLARPILDPEFRCDFGGAEVRAIHFARGLARDPGFEVAIVLRTYDREKSRRIGNLTAYFEQIDRPIARAKELPHDVHLVWKVAKIQLQKLRRSLRKRWNAGPSMETQLQRLISEIPADLIACFGVQQYAGQIIRAAKLQNKKSLLFIAHDQDLDFDRYHEIVETYGGDAETYQQVVHAADHIICQTPHQQQLLQSRFGRSGVVIRNPIDLSGRADSKSDGGEYILWIGRAETFFKRADLMLELAKRCPEIPFLAIMNKRKPAVFQELVAQAPDNVQIIEQVPYQQIETYYANATALLSTSIGEGFPNAFLQAGKYGQPILSLEVDPGEMISQHGCGFITNGDLDAMTRVLKNMWNQRHSEHRQHYSRNILRYVETYHRQADRIEELRQVLVELLGGDSRKVAA